MAETLTIRTASSTEIVKIAVPGPQGPKGDKGDPGDVAGLPLTAQGDTLYRGASENQRLPIGTAGQILKVSSGGVPEWGAAPATGVTSVTGTAPIASSGGNTPAISISEATTSAAGSMSAADKTKLDGIASGAEVNVNADWNASSGDAQILNKPTLGGAAALNVGTTTGTVAAGDDARLSDSRTPVSHAASHEASGSDPVFDQNCNTTDDVSFNSVTVGANAEYAIKDSAEAGWIALTNGSDELIKSNATGAVVFEGSEAFFGFADRTDNTDASKRGGFYKNDGCINFWNNQISENTVSIADNGDVLIGRNSYGTPTGTGTTSSWGTKFQINGNVAIQDNDNEVKATFDAQGNLSANRTYNLPDADGTLMLVGDAPASHTHGNLTNDGKVGSTAGLPLKTGTAGVVEAGAFGTGAGEFAEGNHAHTQLHDKSHTMTDATSHTAGNWKLFYSDGAGAVQELALASTAGHVLQSNGATSAPSFAAASGGISAVGASAADILSVSGSDLVADDLGADKLYGWDDSAGKAIGFTIGSGLTVTDDTLSATASGGTKTYAAFTAEHNQPPASAYATLDTRNSIAVLDFDDATDESAVFVSVMPEGASLGSGLKIRLHWMATSATSGNCVWDVSLERMTTDLDSDSFDTIASATAAANGTSGILTVTEITLTTIDSVTAGDGFRLKVTRDANNASDTMSGDAELVVVEVRSAA